jgi:uncharacterized membrane protein YhaH (DUF805 family)
MLTIILIYVQLSSKFEESRSTKQRFWWLFLTWYSAIVILANLLFIFACLPYLQGLSLVQAAKGLIPDWLVSHPDMAGFVSKDYHEAHKYTAFLPFFFYFVASVYVSDQLKAWKQEDEEIK